MRDNTRSIFPSTGAARRSNAIAAIAAVTLLGGSVSDKLDSVSSSLNG